MQLNNTHQTAILAKSILLPPVSFAVSSLTSRRRTAFRYIFLPNEHGGIWSPPYATAKCPKTAHGERRSRERRTCTMRLSAIFDADSALKSRRRLVGQNPQGASELTCFGNADLRLGKPRLEVADLIDRMLLP